MKKIEAIIRPFRCDRVKEAIEAVGPYGMTLTEVRGMGQAGGEVGGFADAQLVLDLLPKIKIEMVVPDGAVDEIVEAIVGAAHSGQLGDGKIFVSSVQQAVRIRTGERGEQALLPTATPPPAA